MTRSKLEKHLDVLEALVAKPLEFEIMFYHVDQEWEVIKKHLDFLIAKRLVERLPLGGKRVVYSITERGLEVLEALKGTECGQQLDQPSLVYKEQMPIRHAMFAARSERVHYGEERTRQPRGVSRTVLSSMCRQQRLLVQSA